MRTIMPDPNSPAETPRGLHEICEDARRGQCGYCCAMSSEPCAFSGTGPDGYHIARFAWAEASGLISAADMAAVLETAGSFTSATLTGADLRGATLTAANLRGADLTGARWPDDAPVPEGWKLASIFTKRGARRSALDPDFRRLERAGTDSGPTEAN